MKNEKTSALIGKGEHMKIRNEGKLWMAAVTFFLILSGSRGFAANALTPEKIVLEPTFQCMSVEVPFTGDDNANAKGQVQYRAAGSNKWLTGHPLVRVKPGGKLCAGSIVKKPTFFTSLFYLKEDTEYEVKVKLEDADGGSTQLPSQKARTRSSNFKTGGGREYFADPAAKVEGDGSKAKPFMTLTKALSVGGPGDVINLAKGFYKLKGDIRCGLSGDEKAWLHIKGEPGAVFTDAEPELSGVGRLTWEKYKQDDKGRWIYKLPVKNANQVMVRKIPGDVSSGYFLWRYMKSDGSKSQYQGPHRGQTIEDMVEDYPRLNEYGAFVQEEDALYLVLPKGVDNPAKADVQISLTGKDGISGRLMLGGHHVLWEGVTFELTTSLQASSKAHNLAFRRIAMYGNMGRSIFPTGPNALVEDCSFIFNAGYDWAHSAPAKTTKGNRWDPWGKLKNGCNDTQLITPGASSVLRYNIFSGFNNVVQYPSPAQNWNIEMHNNLIERVFDDCVEPDGPGVNWRVYDNKFMDFFNGISDAPIGIGPFFVVRNIFAGYMQAGFKVRNGAAGQTFYYHNAVYPQPDLLLYRGDIKEPPTVWPIPNPTVTGMVFRCDRDGDTWMRTRNNIFVGGSRPYHAKRANLATMDFDYNILATVSNGSIEKTGETHSIEGLPKFKDLKAGDLRLADVSGVDKGEIIKGINDEVPSPWQYKGKAPDIGVCEAGENLPPYGPRTAKGTSGGEKEKYLRGNLIKEKP